MYNNNWFSDFENYGYSNLEQILRIKYRLNIKQTVFKNIEQFKTKQNIQMRINDNHNKCVITLIYQFLLSLSCQLTCAICNAGVNLNSGSTLTSGTIFGFPLKLSYRNFCLFTSQLSKMFVSITLLSTITENSNDCRTLSKVSMRPFAVMGFNVNRFMFITE